MIKKYTTLFLFFHLQLLFSQHQVSQENVLDSISQQQIDLLAENREQFVEGPKQDEYQFFLRRALDANALHTKYLTDSLQFSKKRALRQKNQDAISAMLAEKESELQERIGLREQLEEKQKKDLEELLLAKKEVAAERIKDKEQVKLEQQQLLDSITLVREQLFFEKQQQADENRQAVIAMLQDKARETEERIQEKEALRLKQQLVADSMANARAMAFKMEREARILHNQQALQLALEEKNAELYDRLLKKERLRNELYDIVDSLNTVKEQRIATKAFIAQQNKIALEKELRLKEEALAERIDKKDKKRLLRAEALAINEERKASEIRLKREEALANREEIQKKRLLKQRQEMALRSQKKEKIRSKKEKEQKFDGEVIPVDN